MLGATAACAAFADGHDAPQCAQSPESTLRCGTADVAFIFIRMIFMPATRKPSTRKAPGAMIKIVIGVNQSPKILMFEECSCT